VRARASGGVFARSRARPPWGLTVDGETELTVHVLLEGRASVWVDRPDQAAELAPGDLALVPGGADHHLAHAAGARCVSHAEFLSRPPQWSVDPDAAVFMCGAYRLRGDVGRDLLAALPPVLALTPGADDSLREVIAVIARELDQPAPGQQTALDRLLDLLVVLAMRTALQTGAVAPRWFTAGADPRVAAALHAIHSEPQRGWTVPQLAALSGLSRPAFARNFARALGQSPMRYLTEWRMTLARDSLTLDRLSIGEIADQAGYASANAFAAAFARYHGEPPGRWREQHRPGATL
jgi:AraC-like DNA-binding protein